MWKFNSNTSGDPVLYRTVRQKFEYPAVLALPTPASLIKNEVLFWWKKFNFLEESQESGTLPHGNERKGSKTSIAYTRTKRSMVKKADILPNARNRAEKILPSVKLEKWWTIVKEVLGDNEAREIKFLQDFDEMYQEAKAALLSNRPYPFQWPAPLEHSFISENFVSEEIRKKLCSAGQRLETEILQENEEICWHPAYGRTLMNLIHPALYCLTRTEERRSLVLCEPHKAFDVKDLKRENRTSRNYKALFHLPLHKRDLMKSEEIKKEVVFKSHIPGTRRGRSRQFALKYPNGVGVKTVDKYHQWIPSDVWIDNSGEAHFTSYINGLNPLQNMEVYPILEEVLSAMVPLFQKMLSSMGCGYELKSREIQVYPRMGSILLSPENPVFPGGRKHIEGFDNEHIIGLGIYYYSVENVEGSELEIDYDTGKRQDDEHFYRKKIESLTISSTGGRCVVIPNCHHAAKSFKLKDITVPGHRKTLVFFLVDPAVKVLSTARVPVQQKEWDSGNFTKHISNNLMTLQDAVNWQNNMDEYRTQKLEQQGNSCGVRKRSPVPRCYLGD